MVLQEGALSPISCNQKITTQVTRRKNLSHFGKNQPRNPKGYDKNIILDVDAAKDLSRNSFPQTATCKLLFLRLC